MIIMTSVAAQVLCLPNVAAAKRSCHSSSGSDDGHELGPPPKSAGLEKSAAGVS